MHLPKLEFIEGDVVKVQLTSQTDVAGRAGARANDKRLVSAKVVNHMRVFVMGADGKEREYRFANSSVGVREGHRIAIVRAKPGGPGPWLIVVLYNLTTQMREEQVGAFARAARQQWLGARWRAALWALGVVAIYWPLSDALHFGRRGGLIVSLALGVLAYPTAWAIGWITDRLVLPARQREAEKALRFAIDEKMSQAKADRAAPAKAAPAPPSPTVASDAP